LSTAYSAWDKFNLQKALEILNKKEISGNKLLAKWGIKKRIELNKQVLHKEVNNKFCLERMVDLFENAQRRAEIEKKYDDAVARLYRILEYIAQYLISKKNLYSRDNNGNVLTDSIDLGKLPEDLREKYSSGSRDGKMSLVDDYFLLADLGEEVGKEFVKVFNEKESIIKRNLELRNKSILAHGFNPVDENCYNKFRDLALEYIKKITQNDFERIRECCRFPILKI